MSGSPGQLYTINSVKVQFPCKSYPSQLSMMDKVRICCAVYTIHAVDVDILICTVHTWSGQTEDEDEEEDNNR